MGFPSETPGIVTPFYLIPEKQGIRWPFNWVGRINRWCSRSVNDPVAFSWTALFTPCPFFCYCTCSVSIQLSNLHPTQLHLVLNRIFLCAIQCQEMWDGQAGCTIVTRRAHPSSWWCFHQHFVSSVSH